MTRFSRVWGTLAAICTGTLLFGNAQAAEFIFAGVVEESTGSGFGVLVPPGTPVAGPVVFDDAAVAAGTAGISDILQIDVNVGGFCFTTGTDAMNCPLGGSFVPIDSIDDANVQFTNGFPSGGVFNVTAFSPTFGIFFPINFDLDAGTFFADGGTLGTTSGSIGFVRPEIVVSPNPAAFADTEAGTTETLDVNVTNDGALDLVITSVDAMDELVAPFSIVTENCAGMTLVAADPDAMPPVPAGSCVIEVGFAPTEAGDFNDSFDIVSNDPGNASLTVDVSGTGLGPEISVAPNPAVFPDTSVDAMSTVDVVVTNIGAATLTDIVVAGVNMLAPPFSVLADGCNGASLTNGMSCTVQLQFAPTAGGPFSDSFDIASNDTANPSVTVDVSATALVPGIAVMPSPLAFMATTVGESTLSTVTVTNDGGAPLTIGQLTDPMDTQFTVSNDLCSNTSLAAAETCMFDVTFAPTMEGMFMTSLTIPSNAANDTMFQLDISATGVAAPVAEIELSTEDLMFAGLDVGESATMDIVVTSTGNIDLMIDLAGLMTTGADAVDFTQTNDCPAALAPMATCTITVTFEPLTGGMDKMATLPVNSNADLRPMIDVTLTGSAFLGARINVNPTSLTFGSVASPVQLGTTETASTTVTNTGNDLLVVTDFVFAGGAGEFSVDSEDCTVGVMPGGSCTITVLFAPVTEGDKMGTMTIVSNDGNGLMPVVSLTGFVFTTGAQISVAPNPAVFADTAVGAMSSADVVVTNSGQTDLTDIVVAGVDMLAAPFDILDDGCTGATLPNNVSCTVQIGFAPTAGGPFSDSFDIVSSDLTNPSVTVTVSATALVPEISVAPNPAVFADTPVGATSMLGIVVTNDGEADLTDIVVGGMDALAAPFSVLSDGCTGVSVASGMSCTVQIEFAPTAGGPFSDTFDIASNDPANPDVTVAVSATALVADIAVTPSPLAFMATTVGESMTLGVTVSNNGGAMLDIGQITMPADMQFVVSNDLCSNMSLAGMGGSCTFDVTFAPTADGMFTASLDIPSNDPDTPTFTLDISATGVPAPVAEIMLGAEDLIFDELEVGQSATMDIVVTSTGNADLEIDLAGLVTAGADAVDFTQTNDCPAALAPMATCTITVTFEPLTGGLGKTATLPVNSNAGMRPMIDVTLSGSAFLGARINVDPTELTFGGPSNPLELGTTVTASTTVTNSGNDDLVVSDFVFDGGAGEFSVATEDCTAGVVPAGSCTVTVAFTPVTDGDKTATMTIVSNDADGLAPAVSLTGFVFTGARIDVPALNVDFDDGGTVRVGGTKSVDIVVRSTGTQDLSISGVALGGNNADQFSISENCTTGAVASGSSCTIGVTFAPTTSGLKLATITISSNDVTQFRRTPTTVVTISGNALAVPPAFAQNDEGGVGATGLWLLISGFGLFGIRQRRYRQGARMNGTHTLAGAIVALAATVMLALPGKLSAISFENESGSISGSWDTTLSYGLGYRLQAAADNLIGTVNGGSKFSVNGDDGTLNYHRGIYSNALKVTSELELNYSPANLGLFVRGFYFYDFEVEDGTRDRTPLSPEALALAGSDGDLLDAFVSWQFDIGSMPAEFRVGEQVVNWGESTFIQGGMNVINHINVAALRVPGAELREALLPQDLVFFSVGLTPNFDVEVVYQYDWDDTEPDPAGTYFSTNDFAVDGGRAVRLGFGDTPDVPNPAFYPEDRFFNAIPRGLDRPPSDDGQWGWAARYFAPDFNNGTEFGFYYYNYHSRLPLISARTGSFDGFLVAGAIGVNDDAIANAAINYLNNNPGDTSGAIAAGVAAAPTIPAYASQGIAATAITRGFDTAIAIAGAYTTDAFANTPSTGLAAPGYGPSPVGETSEYFTVFPEDIQLYGFSWNTTLGQTAWQGEVAHHKNRPLQVDDLELLFAGLSTLRGQFAQFGQLGSFSFFGAQANPDTPPLTDINGYFRRDYTQANMAFTRLFSRVFGADQGVALFELAYHHVHGFPSKDVLRFDGAATVVSGNPDLAELAHPGKPILPPEVFPDEDSWGYRLAGRLDFSNIFGTSFNMAPRLAWQHDVDGITPGPAGAFIEGRKAITLGNRFSYQNQWEFDVSYSRFFGAGFQNEIHDRDFVAASVKFTF